MNYKLFIASLITAPTLFCVTASLAGQPDSSDSNGNFVNTSIYATTQDMQPATQAGIQNKGPVNWYPSHKFYVEGKVGYGFSSDTNYKYNATGDINLSGDSIGDSMSYGGEIGYIISPLVRVSLSYNQLDNYALNFNKLTSSSRYTSDSADADSKIILANTYFSANGIRGVNLGRFNPYIGLGAGVAMNHLGTLTQTDSGYAGWEAYYNGATNTAFAARASIGSQIALTHKLYLDIGYSYNYIGDFKSGTTRTFNKSSDSQDRTAITANDTMFNEVYTGLTYVF